MGRFKKKSKMKKILGEFKSIGTYEKIAGVGVVLADYILIAVFLIVPLWVIFEPEWRHIGGGISINDQIERRLYQNNFKKGDNYKKD